MSSERNKETCCHRIPNRRYRLLTMLGLCYRQYPEQEMIEHKISIYDKITRQGNYMTQPQIKLDQKKLILSTSPWHKIILTSTGQIYSPWYVRAYEQGKQFIRWTLLPAEYMCISLLIYLLSYLLGYRKRDDK